MLSAAVMIGALRVKSNGKRSYTLWRYISNLSKTYVKYILLPNRLLQFNMLQIRKKFYKCLIFAAMIHVVDSEMQREHMQYRDQTWFFMH